MTDRIDIEAGQEGWVVRLVEPYSMSASGPWYVSSLEEVMDKVKVLLKELDGKKHKKVAPT